MKSDRAALDSGIERLAGSIYWYILCSQQPIQNVRGVRSHV